MTATNTTPMVRQYRELKERHPGTLLFFRLGDFYELFFEDAVVGARELQITLTARHKERGDAIPMCGVPHHSAANYIAKLVRKGYRVANCSSRLRWLLWCAQVSIKHVTARRRFRLKPPGVRCQGTENRKRTRSPPGRGLG